MNNTTDDTAPVGNTRPGQGDDGDNQATPPPPPPPGPRRNGFDTIDRLRRSRSDRRVAGVAGGLARHFDIDPTVLRVLFVVLTFFGGAGLLLYGAVWVFVPEEGESGAPVNTNGETRKVLLLAALIIAGLLAVGDSLGGFTFGWPLAIIAVFVAAYLLVNDRRDRARDDLPVTGPGVPPRGTPTGTTDDGTDDTGTAAYPTQVTAGQPPYWQPPTGDPAAEPRRPRRSGTVWFWPTLALLAIGLGTLGLYDAENPVADGAYPALALAIIGGMLVVGSVRGRPGGLVFLGFLATIALSANVVVGGEFGSDARQIHDTPTTAAAVESEYRASVGEIRLDLTEVQDPEELAGRTIDLELRTGHVHVIVPDDINVQVEADMAYAGGISVPGDEGGGLTPSVDRYLAGSPATDAAPLELDIEAKFGQITVEQR